MLSFLCGAYHVTYFGRYASGVFPRSPISTLVPLLWVKILNKNNGHLMTEMEQLQPRSPMRCLLVLCLLSIPIPAVAGPAAAILDLTGGRRVKMVWQRDTTAAGNNFLGGADVFKLIGYDTADDTVRRIKAMA